MQQSWTDLTFKQMSAVTTNRSAESEVNMIRMDRGVERSEVSWLVSKMSPYWTN